jgi:3-oxo-5-alpha-steroid 4-dehydrogenase 1
MIISPSAFSVLLKAWMAVGVLTMILLLKIKAPYGRYTSKSWGPTMNSRMGWFTMELPVIAVFTVLFFTGDAVKTLPVYIFYGLFMLHYINRVFIFPFRLRENKKEMPVIVVLLAIFFNLCNGFFNGYWFGWINDFNYTTDWLTGVKFITGIVLFFTGMYINVSSDQRLINLRSGGKKGYYIPYGGLFRFVSAPNLLGEILEWTGWAVMSWCLPGFSFALWTMANLLPRALDHHVWYKQYFTDYPKERKAVIPFLL